MASKVFKTAIELSASLAPSFSGSMLKGSKALAKLGAESAKLTKNTEAIKAYKRLEDQVGKSVTRLASARQELEKLQAEAKDAKTPNEELTAKIKAQTAAVKKAETEFKRQQERLNKAGTALKAAGVDTANLTKEQSRLAAQLARTQMKLKIGSDVSKVGTSFKSLGGELKKVAKTGAVVFGAGAAFGGAAVNKFAAFSKGMDEVSTLVDTNAVSMSELSTQVRNLAKEYGADHVRTAKALYSTISAGFGDAADAMKVLNVANKLAIAGVTDVETTVDGLTTVLNAYGMGAEGAGRASDVMVTTMRLAKTTIPELSSQMFQAAPLASALGVKLEDLSASVVAMTLQGTPTSVAMTRIRAAMDGLIKPSSKMNAIWRKAGYSSGTAAIKAEGLGGALAIISKAAGGDAGRLKELLGSTEAVSAALVIGGSGADAYASALDEISNSSGETDKAFGKMRKGMSAQIDRMKSQFADVMLTIGETLAPVVIDAMTDISKWVNENRADIEKFAKNAAIFIRNDLIPAVRSVASNLQALVVGAKDLLGGWDKLAIAAGLVFGARTIKSIADVGIGIGRLIVDVLRLVAAKKAAAAVNMMPGGGGGGGVPTLPGGVGGVVKGTGTLGKAGGVAGAAILGVQLGLMVTDAIDKAGGYDAAGKWASDKFGGAMTASPIAQRFAVTDADIKQYGSRKAALDAKRAALLSQNTGPLAQIATNSGQTNNIVYSPQVTVQGATAGADLENALTSSYDMFVKQYDRMTLERRRLSYA